MALTLLLTNQLRIYGVSGCHRSICVPLASAAHGAGWLAICRRLSVRPCCDSFVVRRVQKLLPPPHPSDIFVSYMGILLTFHTPSGEHMQTSSQRWCWDYRMSWSVFFFRLFCLHDMYVWSNRCLKSLFATGFSFFLSFPRPESEREMTLVLSMNPFLDPEGDPPLSTCKPMWESERCTKACLSPPASPCSSEGHFTHGADTVLLLSLLRGGGHMFFQILQTHIQTIAGTLLLFNCTLSSSRHTPLIQSDNTVNRNVQWDFFSKTHHI